MRKSKEVEVIRTNEEPVEAEGIAYFTSTGAMAVDDLDVAAFERALRADLEDVSSKIPGSVDPRVLLVMSSENGAIRLSVKAPYSSQKGLRFWSNVKTTRCNELSSRWFSEKWNRRGNLGGAK